MYGFFSNRNFFSTTGKALVPAVFLFIVFQVHSLNAQSVVEKAKKEGKVTFYSPMVMGDTHIMGNAVMKKRSSALEHICAGLVAGKKLS